MPALFRCVAFGFLLVVCFVPAVKAQEESLFDISLEQAVTLAAKNNFNIALERVRVQIAEKEKVIAQSEFDPYLGSSISKTGSKTANTSAFANPEIGENEAISGEIYFSRKASMGTEYKLALEASEGTTNSTFQSLNPSYNTSVKLEITQPLLKGAGSVNRWRIHSSVNNFDIARKKLLIGMSDALTRVHETYWELFFRVENLKAVREALKMAKDHEKRIRAQVEVGSLAPIEIVQAEAFVAANEEEVIKAESQLLNISDILLKLINPPLDSVMWKDRLNPVDKPGADAPDPILSENVEIALKKRPEIVVIEKELQNSKIELGYRDNRQLPDLNLVATISLNGVRGDTKPVTRIGSDSAQVSSFGGGLGDAFSDSASGDYYDYLVGLRVTYPFGNREAKSSAAIARLKSQEAGLRLQNVKKDIILEVRDAVRRIKNGKKQIRAARYARILAEKKLEAEMRKFDVGASTSFNVLEFQKDLTAQRTNELRAMAEIRKAIARKHKAIGSALEYSGMGFTPPE